MTSALLTQNSLVITQTRSFATDHFQITDDQGTPVGAIVQSNKLGEFFMGSRSLAVASMDAQGTPVEPTLVIKDPPNFGFDGFEVYQPHSEEPLAVIREELSFLKTKLSVSMKGFPNVEVAGDWKGRDFVLTSQDREIASVTTQWSGFGQMLAGKNTYLLEVAPGLDPQQHAAIIGTDMSLDMLLTKTRAQLA